MDGPYHDVWMVGRLVVGLLGCGTEEGSGRNCCDILEQMGFVVFILYFERESSFGV